MSRKKNNFQIKGEPNIKNRDDGDLRKKRPKRATIVEQKEARSQMGGQGLKKNPKKRGVNKPGGLTTKEGQ